MRSVALPDGWAPSSLTFFFEDEDLSEDSRPFAANVIFQLRTDVGTEDSPKDVSRVDIETLKRVLPSVTVESHGDIEIGGKLRHHHELTLDDNGRALRQLTFYVADAGRMYTFTATHLAERFDGTRDHILQMASTLLDTAASAKA